MAKGGEGARTCPPWPGMSEGREEERGKTYLDSQPCQRRKGNERESEEETAGRKG